MVAEGQLRIIRKGVAVWNNWRSEYPKKRPDLSGANLRDADLASANLSWTNLRKANLSGADLRKANLSGANLREADLAGANLSGADLRKANLSGANLSGADLREAKMRKANLIGAGLKDIWLIGADLREADLREAYLKDANLSWANLSGANLSDAVLIGSNLSCTNLAKGNLTGTCLYGTARDDWIIDGIKCDHVFWDRDVMNRFPKERDFEPGEFEELYKQLPTIEYVFEKGFTPIDAFLMDQVVHAINEKHPEFELRLDSFHSRIKPRAVFTVIHKEHADEAIKHIKEKYETQINVLKAERDILENFLRSAIQEPRMSISWFEMTGEKYDISGQAGVIGPHAHAHDMSFSQLVQMASEIDLAKLADELSQLRQALRKEADTLEHDSAIGEIAAAELAAKGAKGPQALDHLKKAGNWALEVAEKIGVPVATSALKSVLGL